MSQLLDCSIQNSTNIHLNRGSLERAFRRNFNRLSRILGGYAFDEDQLWLEQMQQKGKNFLIPDLPANFLRQLFSKDSILKSWANLPYVITFLITIALLNF